MRERGPQVVPYNKLGFSSARSSITALICRSGHLPPPKARTSIGLFFCRWIIIAGEKKYKPLINSILLWSECFLAYA